MTYNKSASKIVLGFGWLFLCCFAMVSSAFAGASGASLSPTRIVVPASQKSASVTLRNTSNREVAYRMSLIEMGLDHNGRFRRLEESELHPDHRSARSLVRFSPRQVRLKPGESQVVRVIVRRGGLAPGEYRSHMLLNSLPVLAEFSSANTSPVVVEASSSAAVGVTIPVIVRHGQTQAQVTLEQASVSLAESGTGGKVSLMLGLQGTRSAFGDIEVSVVKAKKEKVVARLKSFALFYPYPRENVVVRMGDDITKTDFAEGSRLKVRYINRAVDSNIPYWLDTSVSPQLNW